jgi:hypothetical protein
MVTCKTTISIRIDNLQINFDFCANQAFLRKYTVHNSYCSKKEITYCFIRIIQCLDNKFKHTFNFHDVSTNDYAF